MHYMALPPEQRAALLETLEQMPQYLEQQFRSLTAAMIRQQGADGSFSPVEQVWHLADLERVEDGQTGADGDHTRRTKA